MRANAYQILQDLITLIILGEEYKFWGFLCNFLHLSWKNDLYDFRRLKMVLHRLGTTSCRQVASPVTPTSAPAGQVPGST